EALEQYPDVFSPFYLQMVQRGEVDSILGTALLTVADYLARSRPAASPGAASDAAAGVSPAPGPAAGTHAAASVLGAVALSALGGAVIWGAGVAAAVPTDWAGPVAM